MNAWLTRLTFNVRNRHIRRILADGSAQHRYLMQLVDDDLGDQPRNTAGLLYRIEDIGATTATAIVQSTVPPLLDRLPAEGLAASQTRQLTPLLDALEDGQYVKYRIAANPTKRWGNSAPKNGQKGKLHVLHGTDAEAWWQTRAQKHGLQIQSVESKPRPDIAIQRARHAVSQFDGLAIIRDATATREAIVNGIGRARSFGCGLLSIAIIKGRNDG